MHYDLNPFSVNRRLLEAVRLINARRLAQAEEALERDRPKIEAAQAKRARKNQRRQRIAGVPIGR